uniref:Uncharacterized protein n=1 Tax=Oxyrrhis marina TaxID=2969 RepID=A0A7S4GKS7_OXYMA
MSVGRPTGPAAASGSVLVQQKSAVADELAAEQMKKRAKGVSVEFLVSTFETKLQNALGDEYHDNTTFIHLAESFWGRREARFENMTSFLGHVETPSSDRVGENGVSLCTAIGIYDSHAVSDATHFLSWSWSYQVKKLLQTLKEYCTKRGLDRKKTFVWMCFFCNDQFEWFSGREQDGFETFGNMLRHIGKMVCIVDTYDAATAIYFKRLWPIYEIYIGFTEELAMDLALMVDSKEQLQQETLAKIKQAIVVEVRSAGASMPDDETRIKEMIAGRESDAKETNRIAKLLLVQMISNYLME